MYLTRLGLKPRIAMGFGSLLAIIGVMGLVGYRAAAANDKTARDVRVYSSLKDLTRSVDRAILVQRIGGRDVMMGRDKESTHLFEHGEADFRAAMEDLKPQLPDTQTRELAAAMEAAASAYMRHVERILATYRAGQEALAQEQFRGRDGLLLSNAATSALNAMMSALEQQRQEALNRQIASDGRCKMLMMVLAVCGLAIGFTVAIFTAQSVVDAMRGMLAMIETVSSNNLSAEDMEVGSKDELGKAALGLNTMKNGLRDIIFSIASAALSVLGSSRDMAAAAAQAASGAEDQKQQVQRIAATIQEMAATVREVSNHAISAAEAAGSASRGARAGGEIIDGLCEGMRGIADTVRKSAVNIEDLGTRSNEIGRIVRVIEEIASQTNLLALNAAIEAARAGEHGRGFSVVATEVRRLTERITAATNDIAAVIQNVQSTTAHAVQQMRLGTTAVDQGLRVAGRAGESIRSIIREADAVGSLVAQIAHSATQHALATEEVTVGMETINRLAAESAEGSKLTSRSCEKLLDLAQSLQKLVDRFEVGQRRSGTRQVAPLNLRGVTI